MKKIVYFLASIVLLIGCSDNDLPDYLEGDVQVKRLVTRIVYKRNGEKIEKEWNYKYDDQNRIIEVIPIENGRIPKSGHWFISYLGNTVIQKEDTTGGYYDVWEYELDTEGKTQVLKRWYHSKGESDVPDYNHFEYFTYEDGYLIYADGSNYDGENRTVYWNDGDLVRIEFTGDIPSYVNWEYGEYINNPYTNMDFNFILQENELSEWFIDPDCLKMFGFFGKRGKHYKTREYGFDHTIEYEYEVDEKEFVVKIFEQVEGWSDEYVYEIFYVDAK